MTVQELIDELEELVTDPKDERPVVTSDGKHVTLVTRYEDAIVLKTDG